MTLPPVVSDPEGPCPGRLSLSGGDGGPHDWDALRDGFSGIVPGTADIEVCRWCGGRKPPTSSCMSSGEDVS